MAQNQTLPLGSGLGAIRAPSLQGDANEAAFRRDASSGGLLGDLFRGIGFQNDSANQEAITKALKASPELASRMQKIYPDNQIFNPSETQAAGGIGLSQVPASGLPDILPSETNIFGDDSDGFKIQTKRGPETISEFAASNLAGFYEMFKPTPEDARRLARARGQVIPGVADEIEAMSIRDASDARTRGGSFGSTVDDAAGQLAGGQETSRILAEAQAGKTFEDKSGDAQDALPQELTTGEMSGSVKGADTPAKQATVNALDEYLKLARPGVKPKDYKEYMKEFADATGLDVSGEADNRAALMAFGLALMQNKAGKGFDVGKMLSSVGEAGEKALPALEKARSEAKAIRAKAGEYALGRSKEDQAAARNRQSIFVVPRTAEGKTEKDRLRNRLMKGRYVQLNSYEMDALANNEGFEAGYEIMPGDVLGKMGDLFKAPESPYSDKMIDFNLFDGADDSFKVKTYAPKADYSNLPSKAVSSSEIQRAEGTISNGLEKLDRLDSKFSEFSQRFSQTPPNVFNQLGSDVFQFAQSLGIGIPDDFEQIVAMEDDVAFMKRFTEYLGTRYAPEILQEAGKTISDADRARVQAIVGDIKKLTSPAAVAARMKDLHEFVVLAGRKNMETAIVNLGRVGGTLQSPPLSDEEEKRYNQLVSRYKVTSTSKDSKEEEDKNE